MLSIAELAVAQAAQPEEVVTPTTDSTVTPPAETIASSQQATQELGNNVIKGNILYAHETMYPRYKKRQEAQHGEKKFKQQFLDMAKTLNNKGVTITNFKAGTPVSFFRVWPQIKPDAKLKIDRGEQKDVLKGDVYYSWLFMVPTTQEWTLMNNKGGPPIKIKRRGFEVAIAKETAVPGQEEWTFIGGSTLSTQELRAMFPSLPQQLVLPLRKDSEIK